MIVPALISPVLAGAIAAVGVFAIYLFIRGFKEDRAEREFRWAQVGSSSMVALAHGTNDAQKTMGVISLALIANGNISGGDDFAVPTWVVVSCALAIALGTYTGGWRIIKTLGTKVVEVRPPQGFGSEAVAATVILASSHVGFPLSTTQVVSGRGHRLRRRPAGRRGQLGRRRPDRRRLGAHAPGGGGDGRAGVRDHRPVPGRRDRTGDRRHRARHRLHAALLRQPPVEREAGRDGVREPRLRPRADPPAGGGMTHFAEIEWDLLGEAASISIAVGLGVLLVATVAVTSSLRGQDARAAGQGGAAVALNVLTVVCIVALAAAIVIGIYFMTDK